MCLSSNSPNLPFAATITDIQPENYRTKTFVFDAKIPALPGQFVMLWLPGFDEKPFSLVDNDPVTLMVTEVGPFTRQIHRVRAGEHLWLRGPFGNGYAPQAELRHALLVGGGYGVAPLFWLARHLSGTVPRVTSAIGARTSTDLLYAGRFGDLASGEQSGTSHALVLSTDDGSAGEKGLVTEVVHDLLDRDGVGCIFACGPHPMLLAVRQMASQYGIPCQLSWEAYMRCGMGICGACEFEGALLCMDGPVLGFAP